MSRYQVKDGNVEPENEDDGFEYCPDCGSDYLLEGTEQCRTLHSGATEYSLSLLCRDCGCEWMQIWVYPPADDPAD